MADITFRAYRAAPALGASGGFSVAFDLTRRPPPFPPHSVNVKDLDAIKAALEVYLANVAKSTAEPVAVSVECRSARRPNGFADWQKARRYWPVNVPGAA